MNKVLRIFAIASSILGILFWVSLLVAGDESSEFEPYSSMLFIEAYILVGVCILAILIFYIHHLIHHPKQLRKTAIAFGLFVGLIVLSYVFSLIFGKEPTTVLSDNTYANTEDSAVKSYLGIDIGLYMFYFLTLIATLLMIVPGVKKVLKK